MQEAEATAKTTYYAVRVGRNPGIYNNWTDCEAQVKGFSNAKFKAFGSKFDALDFIMLKDESLESRQAVRAPPQTSGQQQQPAASAVMSPPKGQRPPFLLPTPNMSPMLPGRQTFQNSMPNNCSTDANTLKIQIANSTSSINTQKRKITVLENAPSASVSASSSSFSSPKKQMLSKSPPSSLSSPLQRQIAFVRAERINFSFNNEKVTVYTDGACSNNGKQGAVAGIGVFWGTNHKLNVSRRLFGLQTNNRAEIMAAIIALQQAIEYGASEVNLHTDSQYTINCINDWIAKWKRNGWMSASRQPVKNVEELSLLDALRCKIKTNWIHVRGHQGDFGNEEADRLARESLTRHAT